LGADKTIDYTREDSINSLERYDFVFDAVGKRKSSNLKVQCQSALTQGGKYVSVDGGMPRPRVEYLVRLKNMIEEGHFKAVIDRSYPLEQIVEAHRYVDQGHKKGNVVITVGH
jgi:NADPH:quinone reductase-like Zn-dependent oxidoreductase